jgi:hypothetical protein
MPDQPRIPVWPGSFQVGSTCVQVSDRTARPRALLVLEQVGDAVPG